MDPQGCGRTPLIADGVKRFVRKLWPLEGAAYLVHNNVLSRFNYSGANLRSQRTPDAVQYLRAVAKRYRDAADGLGRTLVGGRFLEIGPGDSLAVAVCLVAWGAAEVVCIDRFDCLGAVHEQGALYRALLDTFSPEEAALVRRECPWLVERPVRHRVQGRVTFLPGASLESCAAALSGRVFDAVLSNAVLEHVQDPDSGLAAVGPLLAPGGWMFHEVDFRSHGRFENRSPLSFLTVPERWWRLMGDRVGAPNRFRPNYFRRLFHREGFDVHEVVVEAFSLDEARAVFPRLSKAVGAETVEDLLPAVVQFTGVSRT